METLPSFHNIKKEFKRRNKKIIAIKFMLFLKCVWTFFKMTWKLMESEFFTVGVQLLWSTAISEDSMEILLMKHIHNQL